MSKELIDKAAENVYNRLYAKTNSDKPIQENKEVKYKTNYFSISDNLVFYGVIVAGAAMLAFPLVLFILSHFKK